MARITAAVVVAATLVVAAVGCATAYQQAAPVDDSAVASQASSAPAPSASPTASQTPAAPGRGAEDPWNPATWEIEPHELGPISIGDDFDATVAALPGDWVNDRRCAWVSYWSAPDGAYLVSFQRAPGAAGSVTGAAVESLARRSGAGPRTADGLGIGASRAEVQAVHEDAQDVEAADGRTFLRVPGDHDTALFFEYVDGEDGARSVAITSGEPPVQDACA
ncbi:hypothetical protein QWJ90_13120 [Microbacterium oryzae]|uniref:hypothetical protein n=1 Tax=Microbacterium oryzae TaxID=743009 RepID=UPI0025B08BB1|nr:hypothetical protein [Microbacterium oryzae]MDN3311873.1 hypothetical protein [Microbacterium oryzae]